MAAKAYTPDPHRYWADDREDIAAAIADRFKRYQERLESEGRLEVWRTADRCYHGRNPDGGYANSVQIAFGGDSEEVSLIHVGHFRRHVHGQHALATSQRPNIEATAANNDPESVAATQVARQVLDYDLDEGGVEADLRSSHLRALLYSEGYIVQTWDFRAGEIAAAEEVDPEALDAVANAILGADNDNGESADPLMGGQPANDNGSPPREQVVRTGAVKSVVRSPLDVARDLDNDTTHSDWYIVRTRENRWKLAARYLGEDPATVEKREAILGAPAAMEDPGLWDTRTRQTGSESDYVHLLTLYHPPTDALPAGRIVEAVDGHLLEDTPYPYDHCVVHGDIPSDEIDRATGYSDGWDMLALSQALDAIESGILTVADAGSLIRWLAARGQKVDERMLSTGMTLTEYDDDGMGAPPPKLADRPEVRDSDYKLSDHYQAHMRVLSGQNAVVQGDPDANIKSGNFAALVASMAVQAINLQSAEYARHMRSVLTGRLKLYQQFATEARLIEITGRDKSGHVQEFTRDDLRGVRRVRVELANPILRTLQGKFEVADKLLERFPEQITIDRYFALLDTGRLDDLDPGAIVKHKVIARKENDFFRDGNGDRVVALISDHHECHISEHLEQLNDPALRLGDGPDVVAKIQALSAHIAQHGEQWVSLTQTNPALLAATGQRPAPMAAPPGPPGPPGGPPGPTPGPVPQGGGQPPGPGAEPPIPSASNAAPPLVASEQQLPTNPLTGEQGVPGIGSPAGAV